MGMERSREGGTHEKGELAASQRRKSVKMWKEELGKNEGVWLMGLWMEAEDEMVP